MNFREKLEVTSRKNNSLLCVGLDPDPSMIPCELVVNLNKRIVEATIDLVCAYKPNLAIYESMGIDGLRALEQTLNFIRKSDSNVPIIGDGKRGDIGLCSLAYTHTLFNRYNFDAVTVNPYMGFDAVKPFLEYKDREVFILCRTSNPTGADLQDLMVVQNDSVTTRPLYEVVAKLASSWNRNGNVGLVVGATYPEQISRVRQICPDLLFLIPGVGWQGGNVERAIKSAVNSEGNGFIINVSRQIMYAARTPRGTLSSYNESIKKMRHVARQLREEINSHLPLSLGKSMVAVNTN
jgi:orotidine-5'-phosphate decarboxylase